MADARIRELERAVAVGEAGAADALRRTRNRAGQGVRLYVIDLLEQAGVAEVEASSIACGIRAVVKALGLRASVTVTGLGRGVRITDVRGGKDWRVRSFPTEGCGCGLWADGDHVLLCEKHKGAVSAETLALYEAGGYVRARPSSDPAHVDEEERAVSVALARGLCAYFEVGSLILSPTHREDRSRPLEEHYWDAGPRIAPEHQEAFVDAVLANENRTPAARRAIKADDVVRFRVGGRRRYVVTAVEPGGRLSLVALSGAERGSRPTGVSPDELTHDEDQAADWAGRLASRLKAKHVEACARNSASLPWVIREELDRILAEMRTEGFWHEGQRRHDATAWDVNNGLCEEFAERVTDRLAGADVRWLCDEAPGSDAPAHCVVVFHGRYYDAECPEGVPDWRRLPIVRNKDKTREQVLAERSGA